MERGDLGTFKSVEDDVRDGLALLWLMVGDGIKGAGVTQIALTEKSKVCTIIACGGDDMRSWLPVIKTIENYARDEGCDAVRILGRKGWARVLKNYTTPAVILERRLS